MKIEKILQSYLTLQNNLQAENHKAAAAILADYIQEAKNEINATKARSTGKKGIHAAAMRILKNADDCRPILKKAYRQPDGVTICDGFRLIKFTTEEAPELPELDENDAKHYLNPDDIINPNKEHKTAAPLPTLSELKNFIATEKATRKANGEKINRFNRILYTFTDGVNVDALFLLDMLEALPECVARVTCQEYKRKYTPIYFEAVNGCGVLLPVRVNKD